ncbi:MAG: hypothetical protein LBT46_13660 [Planctomycetaceae bacterium]|jgi:hypothetical protein|nr:hypothetical protein [Planctomycetaceae bacterium]
MMDDYRLISAEIASLRNFSYLTRQAAGLPYQRGDIARQQAEVCAGQPDPAQQAAFLNEYEKLKKTNGENDPIYFADGCHPQFNSIPAYGWIRRGQEKELKSNCGRQWVNINGAVDVILKIIETSVFVLR